jgi:hypothetical protein
MREKGKVLIIVCSSFAQVAGPTAQKMSGGHFQGGASFEREPNSATSEIVQASSWRP